MVPNQELLPYAVPIAALTMIIAGTLDPQLAMIVTLMMGLIQGYIAGNVFEFTVYVSITGLIVSLSVKQMAQVNTILWAGLYAAISNVFIILLFRVFEFDFSLISTNTLLTVLAQAGNGILSGVVSAGLAVIAFLIIGNWTDVITHIQLIELSRPTQPLLEELLRRAPGTYHHSLLVSNLAEQAATRIGANVVLCRVGAYYHDVGKMIRPYFFTENQTPGVSGPGQKA
jgi:membrane-associated HD superfamily phosphohydrolase